MAGYGCNPLCSPYLSGPGVCVVLLSVWASGLLRFEIGDVADRTCCAFSCSLLSLSLSLRLSGAGFARSSECFRRSAACVAAGIVYRGGAHQAQVNLVGITAERVARPRSLSSLQPCVPSCAGSNKAGSSVCVLFFTSSSAHRKFPAFSCQTFRPLELCSCLTPLNSRAPTAQHRPTPLVSLASPQNPSSFPKRLVLPASETPRARGVSIREEAFNKREILLSPPPTHIIEVGKIKSRIFEKISKNSKICHVRKNSQPSWSSVPKSSHT